MGPQATWYWGDYGSQNWQQPVYHGKGYGKGKGGKWNGLGKGKGHFWTPAHAEAEYQINLAKVQKEIDQLKKGATIKPQTQAWDTPARTIKPNLPTSDLVQEGWECQTCHTHTTRNSR